MLTAASLVASLLLLLLAPGSSLLHQPTAMASATRLGSSAAAGSIPGAGRIPDVSELRDWFSLGSCQVLFPPTSSKTLPQSIIHFCGGFLLGSASPVAYNDLFQQLSQSNNVIVCTPIPPLESNHDTVAAAISKAFNDCYRDDLLPKLGPLGHKVPVIGLSHSLGGKLMALQCSRRQDRRSSPLRAGNVFLCFNNFGFRDSLELTSRMSPDVERLAASPQARAVTKAVSSAAAAAAAAVGGASGRGGLEALGGLIDSLSGGGGGGGGGGGRLLDAAQRLLPQEQLDAAQRAAASAAQAAQAALDFEFTPSPDETWARVLAGYGVDSNVLVQFTEDELDQSDELQARLLRRGGCEVRLLRLPGGHLAPCGGDVAVVRAVSAAVGRLALEWTDKYPLTDQGPTGRLLGA